MGLTDDEWDRPALIGAPHAVDQAHFVAAPLLAGAAIATAGLLGADGGRFRWPGPAMLCFTLASIFLIASVQLAFRGRSFLYTPAELHDWWKGVHPPSQTVLQDEHRADMEQWRRWVGRAGDAYNLGVVCLGLGAIGLLAPPANASTGHALMRWLAVAAAAVATAWELITAIRDRVKDRLSRPSRRGSR
ncbi:hypothetical protein [Streptomyces chartreusis]|uniref:hypothetical protein n=1 Tax=Streptomyces chartreusis TaxID=1969 RepID=UPI0036A556E1